MRALLLLALHPALNLSEIAYIPVNSYQLIYDEGAGLRSLARGSLSSSIAVSSYPHSLTSSMNRRRAIPEPIIVPLQPDSRQPFTALNMQSSEPAAVRCLQVEEFLQARSLAPQSQKAYRLDLQYFQQWTDKEWAEVTPRQVGQFKTYLMRQQGNTKQRVLSDATVRRILGTLKKFYRWLVQVGYSSSDPTTNVALPKLTEPEAQNLQETEVEQLLLAAAESALPERNLALLWVLLHGLRAEEVCSLNLGDYDGQRLHVANAKAESANAKAESQNFVPLTPQGKAALEGYLQWREVMGEALSAERPLFVSHSRRNHCQRLGYDGLRKVMTTLSKQTGIVFHAHQLRHTFAANLMLKGMKLEQMMTLTRQRSMQNLQRYTKVAEQAMAETTVETAREKTAAIAVQQAQQK